MFSSPRGSQASESFFKIFLYGNDIQQYLLSSLIILSDYHGSSFYTLCVLVYANEVLGWVTQTVSQGSLPKEIKEKSVQNVLLPTFYVLTLQNILLC